MIHLRSLSLVTSLLLALVHGSGCVPGAGEANAAADGDPSPLDDDTGYPSPATDLVPAVGVAGALDVGAWNIRFFPSTAETASVVADVVASLGVDLIALEEVTDADAFNELVARLPEHEGLLSTHSYGSDDFPDQKLGFLYRSSVLTLDDHSLLFTADDFVFPRPPLEATFTYQEGDAPPLTFVAIAVHLKAGREDQDYERRHDALALLESHVRDLVDDADGPDAVVVLGDFNEDFFGEREDEDWAPFASSPDRYALPTRALAEDGEETFIPGGVFIDHIVATTAFVAASTTSTAVVPHLQFDVTNYEDVVSDHLPVVLGHP